MKNTRYEAIVVGASAGAVEALSTILPGLPADYPLPIIIVVHIPPDKKSVMVELIQAKCKMQVREAEDKEKIKPGTVYFAPPDYHLLIEADKSLSLSYDEPELFSRPSINVLFETAADVYGEKLLAVILSGANNDGAKGLQFICEEGGTGLVQNAVNAYAKAMPEAAIKACPKAMVKTLPQIAEYLEKGIYL